jgi:hypothetical protein
LEQVTMGNHESTAEAAMLSWLEQVNPCTRSPFAAMSSALGVLLAEWHEDTAPSLDDLRSALSALQKRLAGHPCPDAALGDRIEVLVARCRFAILEIDTGSEKTAKAHLQVTNNRLDNLNADLEQLLGDLQRAL